MNNELEKITSEIIQQNFDLDEIKNDEDILKRIREKLIDKIDFLLDHDFEKLLWILYRVDVDETKAKTVLTEKSDQKPAEVLVDLIIERQMEKARTRIQYRKENRDE